jgi:hypothetical protein
LAFVFEAPRDSVPITTGASPANSRASKRGKRWGGFAPTILASLSTGALGGAPRAAGAYRVVIEARDALAVAARRTFVLTVR